MKKLINRQQKSAFGIESYILLVSMLLLPVTGSAQEVWLRISGEMVIKDEFIFFMMSQKALCSSYFSTKYQAEMGPGFWKGSYGGEVPLEYLKEKTLDELTRFKVHLVLAREQGLIVNTGFENLLKGFREENNKRKQKKEAGEVIYGPDSFTFQTWFSYWYSSLITESSKTWALQNPPDRDSLEEFYKKNPEDFIVPGEIGLSLVYLPYENEDTREKALKSAGEILRDPDGSDPCSDTGVECEDLLVPDHLNIEAEDYLVELIERAGNLVPGEAAGPVPDPWNKRYVIAVCTSRTKAGEPAFREVENEVRKRYSEWDFKRYIDEQASISIIEVLNENLDEKILEILE